MKYERFEDLPVWNAAIELGHGIYALTRDRYFAQAGDLCDQLRRASLSVSNNVAERFERGSTSELLAFLYYARGSAGEVRSMLHFVLGEPGASHLQTLVQQLIPQSESCSRQLRAWADSLQNSDIKGQRHLNDQSRRQHDSRARAAAFQQQLDETLRQARPEIFGEPKRES